MKKIRKRKLRLLRKIKIAIEHTVYRKKRRKK